MSKVIRCCECNEVKDWYEFRQRTWDGTAICRECEDNDPEYQEERRERLGLNIDWEREEILRKDFVSLVAWLKQQGMWPEE